MDNQFPLVSVITYCFNGARFVSRYFEGVLSQTYPNIELVFIDNGSSDNTLEVVNSYIPRLEARGIRVQFIRFEENQNTCEMKQLGMEKMHGDYFCGCDSDDVMSPTHIEEMVNYLIAHPEKGIVFCQLNVIQEETGKKVGLMKTVPQAKPKAAFLDMLHARNTIFTCIGNMVNKQQFAGANGGLKFFVSPYGENYQLQLPLLYFDLQGYIEKPLGDYYVRDNSYSGKLKKDPMKQVNALKGQEESIDATFDRIHPDNRAEYELIYKRRLRKERFYASLFVKDRELKKECYRELKEIGGVTIKETICNYAAPLYKWIITIKRKGNTR